MCFTRRLAPLALLVFALTGSVFAQAPPAEQVREAFGRYDRTTGPGAIVAVVQDGAVVYAEAFGQANLTHGIPLTVGTRSNIGSTSKQFTAYALVKLAEEGRLDLDADVREYLPALPDFGETVTVRHLLTHTSGYREFLNLLLLEGRQVMRGDVVDRREIVPIVQQQTGLQNTPGAEWNYNNTGYALAAQIVEKVTGNAFAVWMRSNVFVPSGMDSTLIRDVLGQVISGSAQGYTPNAAGRYAETPDLGASLGAGGIYTTAEDLAAWMRVLGAGGPLVEALTTEYVTLEGDSTSYGLGLFLDETRGQRRWSHGGADTAHRSTFVYYPDLGGGYVILANDAAFDGSLGAVVAESFFGDHFEPEPEALDPTQPAPGFDAATFDPESFDEFVGRYALDVMPKFVLTFTRDGDALHAQATGQQRLPIVPTSDSTFAFTVVKAAVAFHRDGAGRVTGLTLHQNGENHATRLPDEVDEIEEAAVDFAPYVGRFFSEELETTYRVVMKEEGDGLVIRQRRMGDVTLAHDEDDAFTGSLPVATAEFERDAAGRVIALIVGNGRTRDIRFERVE